jgi:hypothetical protein
LEVWGVFNPVDEQALSLGRGEGTLSDGEWQFSPYLVDIDLIVLSRTFVSSDTRYTSCALFDGADGHSKAKIQPTDKLNVVVGLYQSPNDMVTVWSRQCSRAKLLVGKPT